MREFENSEQYTIAQNQYEFYKNSIKGDLDIPNGVGIEDIDRYVQEAVKRDFQITSDGKKIPFFDMLSLTRMTDTIANWTSKDNTNTIQLPFFALKKETISEKGTRLGSTINVPNKPLFLLKKIKTIKNNKEVIDFIGIPQPINIDLKYNVIIVTTKLSDLNKMDELFVSKFREGVYYIDVLGHYMPLYLDEIVDNSKKEELESKRYYEHIFKLTCKGYILNANEIRRISALNKITLDVEIEKQEHPINFVNNITNNESCLLFTFEKHVQGLQTEFTSDFTFEYDNCSKNMGIVYKLNDKIIEQFPFDVKNGDILQVTHEIINNKPFTIKICGKNKD